MAINLTVNGLTFAFPEQGDVDWGINVTNWATAVTGGMLQRAGGSFALLDEVDFGSSHGIRSLYYKTRSANIATSGQFRLARADSIIWRNEANDGNLALSVTAGNELQFNGQSFLLGLISNAQVDPAAAIAYSKLNLSNSILNADINASAAIAYSKLNLAGSILDADINASAAIAISKLGTTTADRALETNSSGAITASAITSTELSYLGGVTSAIQTQLNTKAPINNPTFTGDVVVGGNLTVNGATTTINTATLDVEDKNITVNKGGDDTSAEGAGLTIERAGTNGSIIYAAAVTSKFLIGDVGSEVEVATISGSQTLTNKTINASNNTISNIANSNIASAAAIDATKIANGSVSNTEFQYLDGVTSAIQTQIDSKVTNPMTTNGDLITRSGGVPTRLGVGSDGQVLQVSSGAPVWGAPPAVQLTVQAVSGTLNLTAGDTGKIFLINTSAARTVNLPAPSSGLLFRFKDSTGQAQTNNITVVRNGSEQIEGIAASKILQTNWGSWEFISDGTDWFMV